MIPRAVPKNYSLQAFSSSNTSSNFKHHLPLLIIGTITGCILGELIFRRFKSDVNTWQKRKEIIQKRFYDMHIADLIEEMKANIKKIIDQQFTIERQAKEIDELKAEKRNLIKKAKKFKARASGLEK